MSKNKKYQNCDREEFWEKYDNYNLSLPLKCLRDVNLRGNRLKVYILIRNFKAKKGYCWMTNETIAYLCGCSISQVEREIKHLKIMQYIRCYYKSKNNKTDRKIFDNYEIRLIEQFEDENDDYIREL